MHYVYVLIGTVTLALIFSALCSMMEAVLYSLRLSHIEVMAKKQPEKARLLKKLKTNIDEPITAILTLNTIATTIGAAISGVAAAKVFGEQYLIWFSLLFTFTILFCSEILPKTAGVVYARQLAPFIALPLRWMIFFLHPVVWLSQKVTLLIPKKGAHGKISAEELQAIAILSRKSGEIGSEQELVITNILNLSDRTVRQIMTPRTVTFTLDCTMTIQDAAALKDLWKIHSRAPVYSDEADNVVGIVLSRDVYMAAASSQGQLKLAQIMHKAHFVPETAALDRVLLDFFERHQHLFVVVDEYGSVTGVISLEDIIEEIIGREIIDESDKAKDMRELARSRQKRLNTAGN